MGRKIEEPMRIVRVVIYARVSDLKQIADREDDSIDSQIRFCRTFARMMRERGENWQIVELISDGRTGRNARRPGLQRLKELIVAKEVDVVLVNRLNRVFRNGELGIGIDRLAREKGVRIVSRCEPGGSDTASEKLIRQLNWIFAENASNLISEDVKRSILSRAHKGLTHGGVPHYGFEISGGRLAKLAEDAEIVVQMFRMAERGMTPAAIATELNNRGLRTRKRISKKGNVVGGRLFAADVVLKILRNPIYKGVIVCEGDSFKASFEALVDDDLWERVQVALDRRPGKKEGIKLGRDINFLPLKGILRCGCCRGAMTTSRSGKERNDDTPYLYYLCSRHQKEKGNSTCTVGSIPARVIESLVLNSLGEIAGSPETVEKLLNQQPSANRSRLRDLKSKRADIGRTIKALQVEVEALSAKILAISGTVIADNLLKQAERLTKKKNGLVMVENQLNAELFAVENCRLSAKKIEEGLRRFSAVVSTLSHDEQRKLIHLLFQKIVVSDGGNAFDPETENRPRSRIGRRKLELEIKLRPAAIEAIISGDTSIRRSRNTFKILLVTAHCRKTPEKSFGILTPVHREYGEPPETKKVRRKRKTRHEIQRALDWRLEMEELGLGQNELARSKGLSNSAVAQVMAWLKLGPKAVSLIRDLNDPSTIRKVSRAVRKKLLSMPSAEQLRQLKKIIKNAE